MAAYLIANVEINDAEKIKEYMKATPAIIKQFGGKFLVRGGDFEICEGSWNPKRLVLVEFESMQKAKQFYNSPEYKAIIDLRQSSAYTEWIFVDGISKEISDMLNL
ncbi:MAG: DUF1330 domain-containing protein [Planctomycetota bacterium]|nr:MAG: DUF1330 domain-containing protein [Planctomycetota bacterium]